LGDLALYEGRFADAVRILEQGAAEDLDAKSSGRAAGKFAMLAYIRLLQNNIKAAISAADSALANSKGADIRFFAGRVFAEAGHTARARALAEDLAPELQPDPQAYAKLIEGEIALARHDPRQALKPFLEAKDLSNDWTSRFDLGRAYLELGAFTQADSEFDECMKRRGETFALLTDAESFGFVPRLYYYLGRVRQGQNS